MVKSILQFRTEGVKNLEKVLMDYSTDMTRIAEMVYGVTDIVVQLGLSIIAEELETYDEWIRKDKKRKSVWQIVKKDETTLLTSLGNVTYHKTLFRNKNTGERAYLLDRIMGLEKHVRMTEDAVARMLEEAVESSYRKGGESVSIGMESVSKQTVMNKIHQLDFPKVMVAKEKKAVPYLYIDADEDHVALQYLDRKGDIEGKMCMNTIMPKIVYIYEGITDANGRNELINVKYFGGVYEGRKGNQALWDEVREYIEKSYDTDVLKKVFINGDGAAWIREGSRQILQGKFVLDRFHMHKYIIGATAHLKDSIEDARNELYRSIHGKKKKKTEEIFDRILEVTEGEAKRRTVETAKGYILGNWTGIMEQVRNKDKQVECSAEGHVSHVYADRMSSRPLGWSRTGADKMARLRIYHANKGNMLELVRYQKEKHPKAAGGERTIYSSSEMFVMENKNRRQLGILADTPIYSIPYPHIKKIASLKNQIYGL